MRKVIKLTRPRLCFVTFKSTSMSAGQRKQAAALTASLSDFFKVTGSWRFFKEHRSTEKTMTAPQRQQPAKASLTEAMLFNMVRKKPRGIDIPLRKWRLKRPPTKKPAKSRPTK